MRNVLNKDAAERLEPTSIEIGEGFVVRVSRDNCGCTMHLSFAYFGSARVIGTISGMSQEYEGLVPLGRTASVASLPGDEDGPDLPTDWIEVHHVPRDELLMWLLDFRCRHSRRSFTEDELTEPSTRAQWDQDCEGWATSRFTAVMDALEREERPPLPDQTQSGILIISFGS